MTQLPPCAKCSHERFYLVNPFQVRNYEYADSTHPLPVATGSSAKHDVGTFELRVCAGCGFSELYARDLKQIEEAVRSPFGNVRAVGGAATYR